MMSKNITIPVFIGWTEKKTQRYIAILKVLSENKDKWYSVTDIQDRIISTNPEVFDMNVSQQNYIIKKNTNNTVNAYLQSLADLGLVEISMRKNIHGTLDIRKYRLRLK